MSELKLIGNDIEMDGEKIARVFDIRASLRGELEKAIEKANDGTKAFIEGYAKGREDGLDHGYELRGREEYESSS
jgi:flagellar biosynthesis/type III secretory pathway protein FliH